MRERRSPSPLTVRRFSQQKRDCSHAFYRKTILVFPTFATKNICTPKCCLLAHLLRPIFPFEEELRTRISSHSHECFIESISGVFHV